ncbi:NAD-binding protein [Gloeocapsopsis sp. IPPAS B-1203]|uniref:NAD-binding protein n=1 Tax=Gloeocapsopsis sp. IPPAS B-1203 TaxID=2049454 RepID=UPI000C1944DF|nr:NAD-binding protein [Gloeocapsopsis sp. IPPAS B-1203]PIG93451.1 potassium transporter TrkA [Gloeocapsopsis sp. IPPAS B-1203]
MMPSSGSSKTLQPPSQLTRFLVCGLGSLGQHCVAVLKDYGVAVSAIDLILPQNWEVPELPNLLDDLAIGDCRQAAILEQVKIRECRSILLVTSDERGNTEAAFAARLLNPDIRLILRSDKQNLNQLLSENLGNFVAFEPSQLSAAAFALAALGDQTLGYFNLEGQLLRVTKYQVKPGDRWCDRWWVHGLNTRNRRILSHTANFSPLPKQFYEWEPEARVRAGDTIVYIEVASSSYSQQAKASSVKQQLHQAVRQGIWHHLKHYISQFWQWTYQYQTRRVAVLCCFTVLILVVCGTILFRWEYPEINLQDAFNATATLLLGGYGDLFGDIKPETPLSFGLQVFSLALALAGTAFIGVLYALLIDLLLTSRFHFSSRPPIPQQDHIVLIGLGRLGQRVATLLQEFKQSIAGISNTELDPGILPQMPLVIDNVISAFSKIHLENAKSAIIITEDDLENLEIGLMVHAANPDVGVIIHSYDQHFRDQVAKLFPYAKVLCASALSAEVFAAAAFGENVLSLFHFNNTTVLVTEYFIETGDTLNGLMLSEVAYGYAVVPVLYQHDKHESAKFMPAPETRLYVGDRLIVLATSQSLQRIERGEMTPRTRQVQIEKALNQDAVFDGANAIALISGCSLAIARKLMNNLPATLPQPLYHHQAQHLVWELSKVQVTAHLTALKGSNSV